MSNNLAITINDFQNICRTCLSREDLKPLFAKRVLSTYLVDMLISCTFLKFAEDDGLPANICTNCINEINQVFSFAKRCETTDTILRKCVEMKTELGNNCYQSQKVEAKEEMKTEIKPEINFPNMHRTVDVLENFENVRIKQEEDVTIEYVEVKQEEDVTIENEHDETYDHLAEDVDKVEWPRCRSTNSPNRKESLKAKLPENILGGNFKCMLCDRAFARSGHLKYHMRIHTGEKPNVCFVCSEAFAHSIGLKNHMRIHTGEKKPYSCGVCNKDFNRSTHLKYHMRIHTGEKPNICSVCSKAFTHSSSLKNHMRLHTGEKPYICEICSKTFNRPEILKNHTRIHTGEKPNICSVCNKAFAHRLTLRYHMRIHTGEKPYSCEICGKSFITNGALTVHKRTHTKITNEVTVNKI